MSKNLLVVCGLLACCGILYAEDAMDAQMASMNAQYKQTEAWDDCDLLTGNKN